MRTPIEDYLDDLLRRLRSDPRTTRRVLDEATDHLHGAADELVAAGMSREAAEDEAVRRFGAADPLVRSAHRRSLRLVGADATRAGLELAGIGLVAVGLSGVLALLMNVLFGRGFVGGPRLVAGVGGGTPLAEVADDAVVLRVLAGFVGVLLVVAAVLIDRGRRRRVLPAVLTDGIAATAFGAASVALVAACIDQLVMYGVPGTGFFLSGAVVSLVGVVLFCARATRALFAPR